MLKKINCIGNPNVIEKLFSKGKFYKNDFLTIRYEKVAGGPSQFAVSVSKKIDKRAVKRNRLRRQIHEALRLNLPLIKQCVIALISARPACQKAAFQDIVQSVQKFFNTL